MTSRERVQRAVRFQGPDRLPRDFPGAWGTDFAGMGMRPSPDARPAKGMDEWGAVWENLGPTQLGEVKEYPLRDWGDLARLRIPDIDDPRRWEELSEMRAKAGDRFILSHGISLYERIHFLRGSRS
jgi:hypothetical protein